MAESELSVVSSQCLDRRIPDKATLETEVAAWLANRNNNHAKADWQFTTADARIKLKHLYPVNLTESGTSRKLLYRFKYHGTLITAIRWLPRSSNAAFSAVVRWLCRK